MQTPEKICFYPHSWLVNDDANLSLWEAVVITLVFIFDSHFKTALDKDISWNRLVVVPNCIERILMLIYEISKKKQR